jgi:hypothetical protein
VSENTKERPRLEAALTTHEMAEAVVDWLVKRRGWPSGARYDHTVLTVGLCGKPSVFSAEIGPLVPEAGSR